MGIEIPDWLWGTGGIVVGTVITTVVTHITTRTLTATGQRITPPLELWWSRWIMKKSPFKEDFESTEGTEVVYIDAPSGIAVSGDLWEKFILEVAYILKGKGFEPIRFTHKTEESNIARAAKSAVRVFFDTPKSSGDSRLTMEFVSKSGKKAGNTIRTMWIVLIEDQIQTRRGLRKLLRSPEFRNDIDSLVLKYRRYKYPLPKSN